MANPQIIVEYTADTSGMQTGMAQGEKAAGGFGRSLKGLGKAGAVGAAIAGVGALTATIKVGIGEWSESQKVTAQTEAVLKSTGGAANVTAKDVASLSEALMKKSGVDDEAISSGENLLLTFTNIRNEAGKGNDIFDQATAAALDMSVAMGTDMKTSAMQLGKALNDPVAGMTKLQKVGVTFTEGQKAQVKAMAEAGDTMGAQKVILQELNKEFGGSAEALGKTLPGQIEIVRQSFNNLAGELVGKMVPALTASIGWLRDHWPEISAALNEMWASVKPVLTAFSDIIVAIATLIRDNWGTIGPVVQNVVDIFQKAFEIIGDVLRLIAALLRGDWSAAWQEFKNLILDAVDLIRMRVELALLPLKTILSALWEGIKAAASTAWNAIKNVIGGIVDAIKADLTQTWNAIKTSVTTIVNALKTALETAWNLIKTIVSAAASAVSKAVDLVKDAFNAAKGAGQALASFFEGAWTAAVNAAKAAIKGLDSALDAIKGAFNAAKTGAQNVVSYLTGAFVSAFNTAKDAVSGLSGIVNGITGAFDSAAGAVQRLVDAIRSIPSHINLPSIPHLPNIPGLESGGIVSRPTLALIGERGPEAVIPLDKLAGLMQRGGGGGGGSPVTVRVFIGETELRGLVRTEVVHENTGLARSLLAGARV